MNLFKLVKEYVHLRKTARNLKNYRYIYQGQVVRWIDGDTVELALDLGFQLSYGTVESPIAFRLYGINAPEKRQANGPEALLFAQSLAPVGSEVIVQTFKNPNKDNFGRYLAVIYVGEVGFIVIQETNINDELLNAGLAVEYLK